MKEINGRVGIPLEGMNRTRQWPSGTGELAQRLRRFAAEQPYLAFGVSELMARALARAKHLPEGLSREMAEVLQAELFRAAEYVHQAYTLALKDQQIASPRANGGEA